MLDLPYYEKDGILVETRDKRRRVKNRDGNARLTQATVFCISACRDNKVSREAEDAGILTTALLNVLAEDRIDKSYASLRVAVSNETSKIYKRNKMRHSTKQKTILSCS